MSGQFDSFTASELYCPKCGKSQPVREKLLLLLPSGELYEYLCSRCASSLGKRTVSSPAFTSTLAHGSALPAKPRPGGRRAKGGRPPRGA